MKIKALLLNSFVWPSFTYGLTKSPNSFFSKEEAGMAMRYYDRALALMPSMARASVIAVRIMISNHEAMRHAAR